MIIEAGRRQMEELNMTAEMLKTDLKTAYIWRRQAADLITAPVTKLFFCQLVNLCHVMGVEKFTKSLVLGLVNSEFSEADIAPVLEMTLLFCQTPESVN
jgi:hypothetical protein